MEMQGKGGKAFLEGCEKLRGVVPVLEAHDGVIGVAGHEGFVANSGVSVL
jgi:hypothetical protein